MELEHDFAVPLNPPAETSVTVAPGKQVPRSSRSRKAAQTWSTGAGTAKVKLGPIALVYTGTGTWVERDEHAHRMVLEAKGKDKRGNGTAGATITIVLAEESPGRTFVHVLTDLNVTGKPAQFGRGVMQDVSDKLLQQFVDCLEGRFADGAAGRAAVGANGMPVQDLAATAGGAAGGGDASAGGIPARSAAVHGREVPDVVDLGAVGPVLVKQFGPLVGAGLLGLLIGWLLGRRR